MSSPRLAHDCAFAAAGMCAVLIDFASGSGSLHPIAEERRTEWPILEDNAMKGLKSAFWLFVASVMLCLLFDTINPPGWPKWAIPAELAGVMLFFAMCRGLAKMADQGRKDKLKITARLALREGREAARRIDREIAAKKGETDEQPAIDPRL
jgi:hypothetical protein